MAAKPLKGGRLENLDGNEALDSDRASPDSRCVICLGQMQNKSFTDSCLHQFCFVCLVKWSKVKAECPLCKQPFKSIIHNVRSNEDYDQYHVPREEPSVVLTNIMSYRFMVDVINSSAAREYFNEFAHLLDYPGNTDQIPTMSRSHLNPVTVTIDGSRHYYRWRNGRVRQTRALSFRSSVYRRHLWVRPLADVSGRFRECTVQFYRENPAQLTRLAPWVQREIDALFPNNASGSDRCFDAVMNGLRVVDLESPQFRALVAPMLEENTDHFIHELQTFARSVYDMAGFDEHADYTPRLRRCVPTRPPAPAVNPVANVDPDSDVEVLDIVPVTYSIATVQSDSPIVISDSDDSDVVMLSGSQPEVLVISSDEEPHASTSGHTHSTSIKREHITNAATTKREWSSTPDTFKQSCSSTSYDSLTAAPAVRRSFRRGSARQRPTSSSSSSSRSPSPIISPIRLRPPRRGRIGSLSTLSQGSTLSSDIEFSPVSTPRTLRDSSRSSSSSSDNELKTTAQSASSTDEASAPQSKCNGRRNSKEKVVLPLKKRKIESSSEGNGSKKRKQRKKRRDSSSSSAGGSDRKQRHRERKRRRRNRTESESGNESDYQVLATFSVRPRSSRLSDDSN